jgi:heme-degrading monooxygenase HmoA
MTVGAATPEPPYYAVVFTSQRTGEDPAYAETARRMVEAATGQPGFLGAESARGADGLGITVSYWRNLEAIAQWKAQVEHRAAQRNGRERWYEAYRVRVCRVEREYGFERPGL